MKDEAMNKALDAILDDAADLAAEELGRELCDPAEEIRFSPESERRMQTLFRRERRKLRAKKMRRFSKWAACVLLAVVVASGATIFSVKALRVRFLNFILEIGEPNTDYSFGGDQDETYSDDEITLGYIPEGFKFVKDNSKDKTVYLQFENQDDYFNVIVNELEGRGSVDTEDGTAEEIEINGMKAVYTSNHNINSLIWSDDVYSYTVMGNIEKEEMINIAKNVKK